MNNRIKLLRKELDLSQQSFADALNVKRVSIANYESGRKTLTDSIVSLICDKFEVNENWLRHGSGDMFVELPKNGRFYLPSFLYVRKVMKMQWI